MGSTYPKIGLSAGDDTSDGGHATDIHYDWSDQNHARNIHVQANLGNPPDTNAQTYRVEFGAEGAGTAVIGRDPGGHDSPIVGVPSPTFLRVEELAV